MHQRLRLAVKRFVFMNYSVLFAARATAHSRELASIRP